MGTATSTKGQCPDNKVLIASGERPTFAMPRNSFIAPQPSFSLKSAALSSRPPRGGSTRAPRGSMRAPRNSVITPRSATAELYNPGLKTEALVKLIAESIIGRRKEIVTAFGKRELVYADYTASGRLLSFFEDYLLNTVYPLYANSHTESSRTGLQMTSFREEARKAVAVGVNADLEEYAVVFAGTGSTGAMSKMLNVLGFSLPEWANKRWNLESHVPLNERPVVFNGPFEHHSNELLWRESLAVTVSIDEDKDGMPDLVQLENELKKYRLTGKDRILIGSFSAGSNVTGLLPDVRALASLLHRYGALAFFDFAGSVRYVSPHFITIKCLLFYT